MSDETKPSQTDKLIDSGFAAVSFGCTFGVADVLTPYMPGIAAWAIGGAVVCYLQHVVLEALFGDD
jgi:hypothetical protein